MTQGLQVVVFDFDGVIVDSLPGIASSLDLALSSVGLQPASRTEVSAIVGPPLRDGLTALLAARGAHEHEHEHSIDAVLCAFRADYATTSLRLTRLHDGVHALLARLRSAGLRTAIATSKPRAATLPLVELFGLASDVEIVCCPRDGSNDTKTDVLARALLELDVPGARAAMVGDRSHDMIAATALRCVGIGATWGYGSRDELTSAGAIALADRPDDVADLVTAWA